MPYTSRQGSNEGIWVVGWSRQTLSESCASCANDLAIHESQSLDVHLFFILLLLHLFVLVVVITILGIFSFSSAVTVAAATTSTSSSSV